MSTSPAARRPRHWLLRRTPTDIAYLVIVFQTVVSLVVSPLPQRSLQAVWPHALGLVLYWAVARLPWTAGSLEKAGLGLAGGTFLLAAGALVAMQGAVLAPRLSATAAALLNRVSAAFNVNVLAGYLALLGPLCLALLIAPARQARHGTGEFCWWKRLIPGLGIVVAGAALWATGSRAGIVSGAVALVALLLWRWPKQTGALLAIAVATAVWRTPRPDWGSLGDTLTMGAGSAPGLDVRVEIWQRALCLTEDFAFTGLGFGCFEPVVQVMYPLFLTPSGTQPHAHNLLLQVAVDLGLPGLIAFLALLVLTGAMLWCTLRERTSLAGLAVGLLAGFLSAGLHGLLDAPTWGNTAAFLPWAAAALAVPLWQTTTLGRANEAANE